MVKELYDVGILKNVIRPMVLGFKTTEIAQLVSMDKGQSLSFPPEGYIDRRD